MYIYIIISYRKVGCNGFVCRINIKTEKAYQIGEPFFIYPPLEGEVTQGVTGGGKKGEANSGMQIIVNRINKK